MTNRKIYHLVKEIYFANLNFSINVIGAFLHFYSHKVYIVVVWLHVMCK